MVLNIIDFFKIILVLVPLTMCTLSDGIRNFHRLSAQWKRMAQNENTKSTFLFTCICKSRYVVATNFRHSVCIFDYLIGCRNKLLSFQK